MTKMESEGPYKAVSESKVEGPGLDRLPQSKFADLSSWLFAKVLNIAHSEGRKSAKKDLHYEELSLKYLVDRHKSLVDDFKELFEMANILAKNRLCHGEIHDEFDAWKKARGIR